MSERPKGSDDAIWLANPNRVLQLSRYVHAAKRLFPRRMAMDFRKGVCVTTSLDELGLKLKTDKSSKHHNYLIHYEPLLAPIRDEAFDLLEIGVLNGASVRMWHEYFTTARIVGVDVKPIALEDDLPRFTFAQGSQADPVFLHRLAQQFRFRIVNDDGSHLWGHQIFTFQTLFPLLADNGFYICEDLQTSFGALAERYSGGATESAAAYFGRIAQALTAGKAEPVSQTKDPLLHFIIKKIRSITFIRHAVIVSS